MRCNPEEKDYWIEKYVVDLVNGGFIHGWFGDVSEDFIDQSIAEHKDAFTRASAIAKRKVGGDISNLVNYCKWTVEDVEGFLNAYPKLREPYNEYRREVEAFSRQLRGK